MWDWLRSEAGAAWTALIASWLLAVGAIMYRRARRHIIVREATRTVYAQVAPQAADRMTILVDNEPVRRLEELIVSIRNCTSHAISAPAVGIEVPDMRKLISVRAQARPSPEMCTTNFRVVDNTVVVEPLFLNPHGEHMHEVRVAMLLDGEIGEWRANGQGEGWSARRGASIQNTRLARLVLVAAAVIAGWAIVDHYTVVTDTETGETLWTLTLAALWLVLLVVLTRFKGSDDSSISVVEAPDSVMSAGSEAAHSE